MATLRWRRVLAVLCVAAIWTFARAEEEQMFIPQTFLFKGKLIGVSFERLKPDAELSMRLSFLIEDRIVMLPTEASEKEVRSVLTSISIDLANLTVENYLPTIEASLPPGIRLGGSCLLTTHWPGARGFELLKIEPATQETEQQLRIQYHDYILKHRRFENISPLRVREIRLGTFRAQVDYWKRMQQLESTNADEKARAQAQDSVDRAVGTMKFECEDFQNVLRQRLEELRTKLANEVNEEEQNLIRLMIGDVQSLLEQTVKKCEMPD